jgi:pimeloyl-ACP methyl ester carboxylesterase
MTDGCPSSTLTEARELDLALPDGRTLHAYDGGGDDGDDSRLAVFWHHGTPNVGAPPEPLFAAAAERSIRWLGYDRPGYGGSARRPGRDVASAAGDVARVADALGIERFAVMGHSGGSVFALACAALIQERVRAAVCVSALAPFEADALDWFDGMAPAGTAELRAAVKGPEDLRQRLESTDFDPEQFTPADHEALAGPWGWLGRIAGEALEGGLDGMVDDDVSYVRPWGFKPEQVSVPVLFLHGGQDRIAPSAHARWLAERIPGSELWLRPDDGHISVLRHATDALDWLREQGDRN